MPVITTRSSVEKSECTYIANSHAAARTAQRDGRILLQKSVARRSREDRFSGCEPARRRDASIQKNRNTRHAGSGCPVRFVVIAVAALLLQVGSKTIFHTSWRLKVTPARTTMFRKTSATTD
jgi:hypothetical protein